MTDYSEFVNDLREYLTTRQISDLLEAQAKEIAEKDARIAELEAALNGLMVYGCPACNGECSAANPPVIGCPMEAARAALKGERG